MRTIVLPETGLHLYLPSDLSECDSGQYMAMAELIFRYQSQKITYEDLRTLAVYQLLGIRHSRKEFLIPEEQARWANVANIAERIDSFFEEGDDTRVIKQNYIHNPVPVFRPLWTKYYGPADSFMNVSFGEYTDGLRLFMDYSASGNIHYLYLMAAVFYRKKKPMHWIKKGLSRYDGDIREQYNSKTIDKRAEIFRSAPMGFIYGFLLTFASFQKYITGAVLSWGGKEIDLSILFDESNNDGRAEAVPGIGMDSIVFALAESGEFGNLEGVRRANMWEVLIRLYDLRKKDLDYKLNDKSKK